MSTVFILGRVPELSRAEITAVLPDGKLMPLGLAAVRYEGTVANPASLLARLGGTVKVGEIVAPLFSPEAMADDLVRHAAGKSGKIVFGLSFYGKPQPEARRKAAGMAIKSLLKERGFPCRLLTGRAAELQAVAVRRERCVEYLVLPDGSVARTLAVQDVDDFTRRDVGRPHRDLVSGTLPPKLARIMVNLARLPAGGSLLDPFCGSGTVLTEAVLTGAGAVTGSDISPKAVAQSQGNLLWIARQYASVAQARWNVVASDVRSLSKVLGPQRFDAVVTEPYLGPPRRGRETRQQLEGVAADLGALYRDAFREFRTVLKPGGRVVFAAPVFLHGREVVPVPFADGAVRFGFARTVGPLPYFRPDQLVRREISVWELRLR